MNKSFLAFRNFLYLKITLVLVASAIVAYWVHEPVEGPNGGSWLGYTLGVISALVIFWHAWLGIRKRQYGKGVLKLEDWVSAHIYLGLALIVLATLHCGFQFGLNLHTLAYTLMMLVIVTGAVGMVAYLTVPKQMTDNQNGLTRNQMMGVIADTGVECQELAMTLGDEINRVVLDATENALIGGSVVRLLSGRYPHCPNAKALEYILDLSKDKSGAGADAQSIRRLVELLGRRQQLLSKARQDARYQAFLECWLYFHVPLSIALMAALTAHIVSVFFYW